MYLWVNVLLLKLSLLVYILGRSTPELLWVKLEVELVQISKMRIDVFCLRMIVSALVQKTPIAGASLSRSQLHALNGWISRPGPVRRSAELWVCGESSEVQDCCLLRWCWSSSVFRVSGSVTDSVGSLLFSKTVRKWTMQVNELWPPSQSLLCQVLVCLSCQWWLIVLDSAKASATQIFCILLRLFYLFIYFFYCCQIQSLFTLNDKTDTTGGIVWMRVGREVWLFLLPLRYQKND